jgi:hypothetical protein
LEKNMGSQKKRLAAARQTLTKLQARHAAMTERIERTRHKLDKRAEGLRRLEAKISQAERRAYALAHPDGEPAPVAMPNLRRAYLIFNPTSGPEGKDGRSPQSLLEALRAHGIEAEVGFKTSGKVARQLAREALKHKHDLVITSVPPLAGPQPVASNQDGQAVSAPPAKPASEAVPA